MGVVVVARRRAACRCCSFRRRDAATCVLLALGPSTPGRRGVRAWHGLPRRGLPLELIVFTLRVVSPLRRPVRAPGEEAEAWAEVRTRNTTRLRGHAASQGRTVGKRGPDERLGGRPPRRRFAVGAPAAECRSPPSPWSGRSAPLGARRSIVPAGTAASASCQRKVA